MRHILAPLRGMRGLRGTEPIEVAARAGRVTSALMDEGRRWT